MSSFVSVLVSDPWLQSQITQVELRGLKTKFLSVKRDSGHVTVRDMSSLLAKQKALSDKLTVDEIAAILAELHPNTTYEIDFETFLRSYLTLKGRAAEKMGGASAFVKTATTSVNHTVTESEKSTYVTHINNYLKEDPFLKEYLPLDAATNAVFDLAKDGVLLCKLINVAVPGTIDESAIITKRGMNPWDRNQNLTLCLNSAKAIGCTVVNIGTQDLVEGTPHLVLDLISQIIKLIRIKDDGEERSR